MSNKNINISRQIGQKIKFMRNMRNISSVDMANILGISRQQLQNYERGYADIKIDRLFEIAKILDIDVNFFFEVISASSDSYDTLQNLMCIKDIKLKETICSLIKELSKN